MALSKDIDLIYDESETRLLILKYIEHLSSICLNVHMLSQDWHFVKE